jgi:hypothetical protein
MSASQRAWRVIPVLACVWLLGLQPAQAGTITNVLVENFDELTPMETVTSAGAFYTINGTNVDIVGGPSNNSDGVGDYAGICGAPESGNCIDLDGTGGQPQGQLQAAFLALPAADYTLSFDLIGAGGAAYGRSLTTTTTVMLGDAACSSAATCLYYQTFTLGGSDVTDGIVSDFPMTITQSGDFYLTFISDTPGQQGALLDNVVFADPTSTASQPSVPEPSTLTLMGTALLALLALPRLHRRTR